MEKKKAYRMLCHTTNEFQTKKIKKNKPLTTHNDFNMRFDQPV